MKKKIIRLLWVALLMICSFTLGYTLKPGGSDRAAAFRSGRISMPTSFGAPPTTPPQGKR